MSLTKAASMVAGGFAAILAASPASAQVSPAEAKAIAEGPLH